MRPLHRLNIRDVKHLCKLLGVERGELETLCLDPARYYRRGVITDSKGKPRPIAEPRGRLRQLLDTLNSLLQRIVPFSQLCGGAEGVFGGGQ